MNFIRNLAIDQFDFIKHRIPTTGTNHITYVRQTLQMWLLMIKIIAHFALTVECEHLPEYALWKEPTIIVTSGKQLQKGTIAPTIEAAVLHAEETVENLNSTIKSLQANKYLNAEELAQALAALPRAKMTTPGCFYRKLPGLGPVWIQHPECDEHHRTKLCGWPLQKFPPGWLEKATELLKEFDKLVIGPNFTRTVDWVEITETSRIAHNSVIVDCLRACVNSRTGGACVLDGRFGICPRRGACVVDDCVGICPRRGACAVRAGVDDAGVDDAGVDDAGVDDACVDDACVDDDCVGICPRKRPNGLKPWQVGQLRMVLASLSIWGGLESSVYKERIEQTDRVIFLLNQYEQISCP